jgi:AraC family transcriptional regulator, transcriptional activator of pobA
MTKKIPTYSICNLLGADRCMASFVVTDIRSFVLSHQDLYFPHRHDFYQLVLFTAGGGQHTIDFKNYNIARGQVYAMTPGQVHTWQFEPDTQGFIVNFHESFFTAAVNKPHYVRSFSVFDPISTRPVNMLVEASLQAAQQLFEQMLEEFGRDDIFRMETLRSLLTLLLVRISRAVPVIYQENASSHHLELMRQFELLVEQHFYEKRLPKAYAELLFISPNHLNAITNAALGTSAGDVIRERVLLEIKRLLVNSDLLINQIADRLNFEDNAYFSRFFKKYTGASPEAFRAAYLKNI